MAGQMRERDAKLAELFEEHRLWLLRLATLLTDDQGTAEDIVQNAYVGLLGHWRRRDDAQAIAYLRVSVVNGARSALRRRRSDRARLRLVPDEVADTLPEPSVGPATEALLADQRRRLFAAVTQLPPRQREVLVLRYWGELSEAEIAHLLGISAGTVKSSASRGIAALASRWEEEK